MAVMKLVNTLTGIDCPDHPHLGPPPGGSDIQAPQTHAPRLGLRYVVGEPVSSPVAWIKIFLSWLVYVCTYVWIAI